MFSFHCSFILGLQLRALTLQEMRDNIRRTLLTQECVQSAEFGAGRLKMVTIMLLKLHVRGCEGVGVMRLQKKTH